MKHLCIVKRIPCDFVYQANITENMLKCLEKAAFLIIFCKINTMSFENVPFENDHSFFASLSTRNGKHLCILKAYNLFRFAFFLHEPFVMVSM